ncbi:MAG: ATP-binding protein, partial [Anaerolineales bacterium]
LVRADRQQLRQVFLNLFTNAADAMPASGRLTIRIQAPPGPGPASAQAAGAPLTPPLALPMAPQPQVCIEISDTGEGIAPETLPKVWEPFYTTKPEGRGTGLGLAICRRIVQEHGGAIELISTGVPGQGTTVRITLPGA